MKKWDAKKWIFMIASMVFMLTASSVIVPAATIKKSLKVKKGSDITWELQEAFDLARDDKKENTYEITIPKGKYKISDCLNIYSNTHLVMKGVTISRIKKDNLTMLRTGRIDLNPKGESGYSGFHNIKFIGGTWDGNSRVGSIIRVGHANDITFEGVTFRKVKDSHHVEIAACRNVVVEDCVFSDFVGDFKTYSNREALQFDIINGDHFAGYPKYDETPNKNIVVRNCTFKNLQRGMGSHSAVVGKYFDNIVFEDNTFENITGYAILLTNYRNSKVTGNTITDCGSGIIVRTMNKNRDTFYPSKTLKKIVAEKNLKLEISNNTIQVKAKGYPNMAVGISLYGEQYTKKTNGIPKGDYRVKGVTVTENTISFNCKGVALCLQGACQNVISKNKIVCRIVAKGNGEGTGDAIRLILSSKNTISGNHIINKKTGGMAALMHGIGILEKSDSNKISKNKIENTSADGIVVKESKNVKVLSNQITDSHRIGLFVSDKATVSESGNIFINCVTKDKKATNGATINGMSEIK